ncbi:MAG: uncharacterized protein JWQ37_2167 [Blastococcus sp.]|jgi:hypothetical protein|nr:uncharacterized protein [Blastococcus sp.]
MTDDMTIRVDSDEYVLRRDGDGLQVGRRVAGDVAWLDTVDLGLLPGPAREALERGDTSDADLLIAVRGIAQAEDERGG